jgi:hypothetical protein
VLESGSFSPLTAILTVLSQRVPDIKLIWPNNSEYDTASSCLNRWYVSTKQHGITSKDTVILLLVTVKTSDIMNLRPWKGGT